MSDNEWKRAGDEPTGDGFFLDICRTHDFVVEVTKRLSEIALRNHSAVPLANEDRDNFCQADAQDLESVSGHSIEDCIDLCRSGLRHVPLRQRTSVEVEGV